MAAMSSEISTALVKQFHANFDLLCQQKDSRFGDCVRSEPINAEDGFYDQIGESDGADITTRHADTQYADSPHERRKVTPIPWQWADLIDRADKVRMLGDPQNTYLMAAHAARNRRKDDHIVNAFFGTAYTGKTGTTAVTFPAANVVAVDLGGSAEGLTINKLIRARKLLIDNDVDMDNEELFIAVNGKALEDLLKTTQVTSADYNTVKALVNGDIDTFMGFKFKTSNRLLTDASGYYRLPVWAKSGMLLAVAEEQTVEVERLAAKNYSTQVYVGCDMGATRMEEEKVIEIKITAS
jgi:hypothetical protein